MALETGSIEVEITGVLMDNIEQMKFDKIKERKVKYDAKVMAEASCYKDKKGLYIPARAIFSCILNGAREFKVGKRSLSTGLSGAIMIEPEKIYLGTDKYEIDERTIVNRLAGRCLKARAKIPKWSCKFVIKYYKDILQTPEIMEEVMNRAGIKVGILSYRPQKMGNFGCFQVTSFKVK